MQIPAQMIFITTSNIMHKFSYTNSKSSPSANLCSCGTDDMNYPNNNDYNDCQHGQQKPDNSRVFQK